MACERIEYFAVSNLEGCAFALPRKSKETTTMRALQRKPCLMLSRRRRGPRVVTKALLSSGGSAPLPMVGRTG